MPEPVDATTLAELTTEIVAAYVARHPVRSAEVPVLIEAVATHLARLGGEAKEAAAPAGPEPAVPVRRSVTPEHLVCLVCGQRLATLKRHLRVAHGLTPAEYREAFGLKGDYPLIAPAYAARRAEIARQYGLGLSGPRRAPVAPPRRPAPRGKGRREEGSRPGVAVAARNHRQPCSQSSAFPALIR